MKWLPLGLGIIVIAIYIYLEYSAEITGLMRSDYINAGKSVEVNDRPLLIWFMYSYVPNVRAGTEVSAHAVNKWLIEKGWNVVVCCSKWCCNEYEGVTIVPISRGYEEVSPYMKRLYSQAKIFCVQNYMSNYIVKLGSNYKKSVYQFIHVEDDKNEIVNLKQATPIYVVYNSQTVKVKNPTVHPNIIVRPYVDIEHFRQTNTEKRQYVTLINCNKNKGGEILEKLAYKMPGVKFLGIKGSYAKQVLTLKPGNLTYWESQEDMLKVYAVTKILIMPSEKETWGRTAVEAMAGGIPVVVSRVDGLMECVKDGGQICMRDDIQCWVTTIQRLLDDPAEYERWARAGLARVEQLDTSNDMEKLDLFLKTSGSV